MYAYTFKMLLLRLAILWSFTVAGEGPVTFSGIFGPSILVISSTLQSFVIYFSNTCSPVSYQPLDLGASTRLLA